MFGIHLHHTTDRQVHGCNSYLTCRCGARRTVRRNPGGVSPIAPPWPLPEDGWTRAPSGGWPLNPKKGAPPRGPGAASQPPETQNRRIAEAAVAKIDALTVGPHDHLVLSINRSINPAMVAEIRSMIVERCPALVDRVLIFMGGPQAWTARAMTNPAGATAHSNGKEEPDWIDEIRPTPRQADQ